MVATTTIHRTQISGITARAVDAQWPATPVECLFGDERCITRAVSERFDGNLARARVALRLFQIDGQQYIESNCFDLGWVEREDQFDQLPTITTDMIDAIERKALEQLGHPADRARW